MTKLTDLQTWSRLYEFMAMPVAGGVESSWCYGDMQVWPIIRSQICMRGSNVLCADRQHMKIANAPGKSSKLAASVSTLGNRLRSMSSRSMSSASSVPANHSTTKSVAWPLPAGVGTGNVWCLGYATNHKKVGDSHFQICMDPLRVALATQNVATIGLMTGLADDAPGILQAAAQPTINIETEFRAVRKDARNLPRSIWMLCQLSQSGGMNSMACWMVRPSRRANTSQPSFCKRQRPAHGFIKRLPSTGREPSSWRPITDCSVTDPVGLAAS